MRTVPDFIGARYQSTWLVTDLPFYFIVAIAAEVSQPTTDSRQLYNISVLQSDECTLMRIQICAVDLCRYRPVYPRGISFITFNDADPRYISM